ncbi:MAG: hypothetical protein ABS35_12935 [Kaistia sp. SCN 65-12]|nr:MAG: hypothetical protein ABS35_12935 [Kaistia sp. SCN 65-12]
MGLGAKEGSAFLSSFELLTHRDNRSDCRDKLEAQRGQPIFHRGRGCRKNIPYYNAPLLKLA